MFSRKLATSPWRPSNSTRPSDDEHHVVFVRIGAQGYTFTYLIAPGPGAGTHRYAVSAPPVYDVMYVQVYVHSNSTFLAHLRVAVRTFPYSLSIETRHLKAYPR